MNANECTHCRNSTATPAGIIIYTLIEPGDIARPVFCPYCPTGRTLKSKSKLKEILTQAKQEAPDEIPNDFNSNSIPNGM